MYIVVVYDIVLDVETNGTRILRNVFKICKKYLNHIQNSVFEGELTNAKLEALKCGLKKYIRPEKDSVIILNIPQING